MLYNTIIILNLKDHHVNLDKSFDCYKNNIHYIDLYLNRTLFCCKKCNSKNIFIQSSKLSKIKYSTSIEPIIIINFHKRIFKCNDCNHYFSEELFGVNSNKNILLNTDLEILNELKNHKITYSEVAKKYNVSSTYVLNVFDTKVDIKPAYLPQVLCIDEVYSKKLTKYHYCCVLYSPQLKK